MKLMANKGWVFALNHLLVERSRSQDLTLVHSLESQKKGRPAENPKMVSNKFNTG